MKAKVTKEKVRNLPNELLQMADRTETGRNNKATNISQSYER